MKPRQASGSPAPIVCLGERAGPETIQALGGSANRDALPAAASLLDCGRRSVDRRRPAELLVDAYRARAAAPFPKPAVLRRSVFGGPGCRRASGTGSPYPVRI